MSQRPILLVEDDENDVFFFERAMARAAMAYPVEVVRDGREAIAYLSGAAKNENGSQRAFPCLVLLDLNLPHKHGLEILQFIRSSALNPTVPVVVLTSSAAEHDLREAYRLGANSYLLKPSKPEDLVEVVRVLKRYWFDFNRAPGPCGEEVP